MYTRALILRIIYEHFLQEMLPLRQRRKEMHSIVLTQVIKKRLLEKKIKSDFLKVGWILLTVEGQLLHHQAHLPPQLRQQAGQIHRHRHQLIQHTQHNHHVRLCQHNQPNRRNPHSQLNLLNQPSHCNQRKCHISRGKYLS